MQNRSMIFAVSIVLLVPFLYYTTSIPNTCAVPPDPKYLGSLQCTTSDDGKHRVSCCWKEGEKTFCQTCAAPGGKYDCGPVNEYLPSSRPQLEGGVLEDPATSPKLEENVGPRGEFQELPENNMTFSEEPNPNLLKKSPNLLKKSPSTGDPITGNLK